MKISKTIIAAGTLGLLIVGSSTLTYAQENSVKELAAVTSSFQRNSVIGNMINTRLTRAVAYERVTTADGVEKNVPVRKNDGFWFKGSRNFSKLLNGSPNMTGKYYAIGFDNKVNRNWRVGGVASYGRSSYGGDSTNVKFYDGRLGIYGGYHKHADDGYIYLDYGQQHNHTNRHEASVNTSKYHGNIIELGGEFKRDLKHGSKRWHYGPYAKGQASRYHSNAYSEKGNEATAMSFNSLNNTYVAGELGMEVSIYGVGGSLLAARAGYKRVLTGADPRISTNLVAEEAGADKDFLTLGFNGRYFLAKGWSLVGDFALEKGKNERSMSFSVSVKKAF